jgi:HPt (histidine-containing phosphotransfer) domain-containing protein
MTSEESTADPSRAVASCLDKATLDQLIDLDDGQTGLLAELFGLFKEDTPSRMEGLKRALADGNSVAVSELAHALKGASGTIGAKHMREIAHNLEKAGKAGSLDAQVLAWTADLEAAYDEACAALQTFIDRA